VSLRSLSCLAFLFAIFSASLPSLAQNKDEKESPRFQAFGGFSQYRPGGSIDGAKVSNLNQGWAGQFSINCSRVVAIVVDANGHYSDSASAHGFAFGPQFRFRWHHLAPFSELLVGFHDFAPKQLPSQNTATYIFGGGLDLEITRRISIRPFQIDFVKSNYNASSNGVHNNVFNGFRDQAGIVYSFGIPGPPENIVTVSCTTDPSSINAGAPVSVTVAAKGFQPQRVLTYSYSSTGGKVAGDASSASVDTTGLAPGSYTVSAKVADNGKGKHQQTASCQTAFKINEPPKPHPPLVSVSAQPSSLKSGDAATITATSSSPDNRPLSLACKASGGRLSGSGQLFTLDTAGVPDSTVSVNCTVTDDRNLSASASASVRVNVPPPPPDAKEFGRIEFKHDLKRPTRVDNEAKGELDRYADALAAATDAKGVVVGYAIPKEIAANKSARQLQQIAAQRAVNTKDYLVKEKGVDSLRVQVRTSAAQGQAVKLCLLPAGATFPTEGSQVVDEGKVKAMPRVPLKTRKRSPGKTHLRRHKP
jgi:hypothetical protein